MAVLPITPYQPIADKAFGDIEIELTTAMFQHVTALPGKSMLFLERCLFKKVTIIYDQPLAYDLIDLTFLDCFIERLEVRSAVGKNLGVYFHNTIIDSGVMREGELKSVQLVNCISDGFFIKNTDLVRIEYTESTIYPLRWRALLRKLGNKDQFNRLLERKIAYYVEDIENLHVVAQHDATGKPGIYKTKLDKIRDSRYRYRLTAGEKASMSLNLDIKYSGTDKAKVTEVKNIYLRTLSLQGTASGKINVEECTIDRLYLRKLVPKGELVFYYISTQQKRVPADVLAGPDAAGKPDDVSKVEIHQCTLDNAWFDNFDFAAYSSVSLFRTRFSKTIFSACNFPDDYRQFDNFRSVENIHYPHKKKDNYHMDMYEIFLQLRKALEGTGNFQESLKLHAVSNDALREIKRLSWWDNVILCINKVSNNHGISLKRAFWGFWISSGIVYILYLVTLGRIFNCQADFDPSLIGYYFAFIDLTHRNDFLVTKGEFGHFTLAVDFFGKLVVGFFIFQFVAAFRKYGKK
ncbi:hypothetical protein [Chitinophaga sp. 212800010-3]|uniref:hypothetical protein n=1 Tax=unclassified Chitinophaga TaxID=2619133 RepID=UPI002DE3060D|nr:hypothetical protein [Chitinophaga sp. 212800010-3]